MLGFILNIPYTIIGLMVSLISIPTKIKINKYPRAIIFNVKSFWWTIGYMKNARAMTIGHVILLGPNVQDKDLEHELVHVEQYQRIPLIHPILYYIEFIRVGYRKNKYEEEAYDRSGSLYKDK